MIAAVVLAAGQSKRMGRPKMTLPWGDTTVIGRVVTALAEAGLPEILVVTGGSRPEVEEALRGLPGRAIYNPDFAFTEMLVTFQAGLKELSEDVEAAFVVLGDQPQIETAVVESVITAYRTTHAPIVVPSYQMRRGHPWLLDRSLWSAVLKLRSPATLRDFLNEYKSFIHYLPLQTASILQDLDTPADYEHFRPSPRPPSHREGGERP